jgi:hypothetical protein
MQPNQEIISAWRASAPFWEKHREIIRQMFAPVTQALVADGLIGSGNTVLDIATGPGEPALTIAALVGSEGEVFGIGLFSAKCQTARASFRPGLSTRLQTLMCARASRNQPHIVLTLETLPFVRRYADSIVLSPMNSGNTQPIAHPRGPTTFQRMRDYPFAERAKYGEYYQVVELAVEGGADVNEAVLSVDLMQCQGKGIRQIKSIFTGKLTERLSVRKSSP